MATHDFYGLHVSWPYTDWNRLFAVLDQRQPRGNVSVDSAALGSALADRYPDSYSVARRFWPDLAHGDKNTHLYIPGVVWVNGMDLWLDGDRRVLLSWNNEPDFGSDWGHEQRLNFYTTLADEAIAVYKAARQRGYTVVGPNFGARWPQAEYLETLEPMLHMAAEYGHFIGFHPYGGKTLLPQDIQTPQGVWHVGEQWFIDTVDQMLAIEPRLRFMATECGLDYFPAIPGSGPYRSVGVGGQTYADMHIYAWEHYFQPRGSIVCAMTFAWHHRGVSDNPFRDFDVSDDAPFHDRMAAYDWPEWEKTEPKPAPVSVSEPVSEPAPPAFASVPVSQWVSGILYPAGDYGVRVRAEPGLTAQILGGITPAGVAGEWDSSTDNLVQDGNIMWRRVRLLELDIRGWVSDAHVRLLPDALVSQPEPQPPAPEPRPERAPTELTLNTQELEIFDLLSHTWNKFGALPRQHPSDMNDFAYAIHAAQNIVLARPAYRLMHGEEQGT